MRLTHRITAILTGRAPATPGPADPGISPGVAEGSPPGEPTSPPPGPTAAASAGQTTARTGRSPFDGPGAASAADGVDPCAPARDAVADACSLAERMAALSMAAQDRLREARRTYDEHASRRERAAAVADPRAVRAAKDEAHAAFRNARLAAADQPAIEAAAREWLREIDRINARTREAVRLLGREDAAESELLFAVERLGVEADGARIAAESAAEACRNARITLATCEERERAGAGRVAPTSESLVGRARFPALTRGDTGPVRSAADVAPAPGPAERAAAAGDASEAGGAIEITGEQAIIALLAGDRAVLRRLAGALAEGDAVAAAGWELNLTALVEAIMARAIDGTALAFPEEHPFWGPHTQAECREITAALAALGYRYDGSGGFADGRVPGQRELSLALGYAGLDPMRIRIWPTEAEMPHLFEDVRVDAGHFVAEAAGGLTLGEMIDLLGRRAEELSDTWNAWGRLRPLLLGPA